MASAAEIEVRHQAGTREIILTPMKTFRPCLAEFLGTFYLCFPGIAAILATSKGVEPGAALLIIALAHGVGLSLAVSNFGGISGAHVNPAITCGFLVTGRITPSLAAGGGITGASMNPARSFGPALEMMHWQWHWAYWIAPIAGACAAALVYENLLLKPMKPDVDEPRAMKR